MTRAIFIWFKRISTTVPKFPLWIITILAAVALAYESHRSDFLGVGWGGDNIIGGAIRVSFSFLVGVLAFRSKWIIKSNMGFVAISVLLLAAFLIPYNDKLNWFVDPLVVIFYFPLLMALGAGAIVENKTERICKFSGDISYPLYMVHYPFIWLFMSYVEFTKPTINEMIPIIIAGTITMVILAYVVMKVLDIPIRSYLKLKWLNKA